MSLSSTLSKSFFCAVLGASLVAGVATPARADRDDHCHRNVEKAERNLDKAVRRHGERSRQAEKRRHELEEVRERCHERNERNERH